MEMLQKKQFCMQCIIIILSEIQIQVKLSSSWPHACRNVTVANTIINYVYCPQKNSRELEKVVRYLSTPTLSDTPHHTQPHKLHGHSVVETYIIQFTAYSKINTYIIWLTHYYIIPTSLAV